MRLTDSQVEVVVTGAAFEVTLDGVTVQVVRPRLTSP